MKEKILTKIKKLMALTTDRGATPEEAALATAKVSAMLIEHNLTIAQAQEFDPDEETINVTEHHMDHGYAQLRWRRILANVICKFNLCHIVVGRQKTVYFFGKPSNVEVVIYLTESIAAQIHKMAKAAMKLNQTRKESFYQSFCRGAIKTIHTRLAEDAVKSSKEAQALVLNNNLALRAAVDAKFDTKVVKHQSPSDGGAFIIGQEAGKAITMHKGMPHKERLMIEGH